MHKPLVSVIIPSTMKPVLLRAVESALRQTHSEIEILVCIGSRTVAWTLPDEVLADGKVKVFSPLEVNPNGNTARNQGIREARGEFIAFLDDDDFWEPSKIERHLQEMHSQPDSQISVSKSLAIGKNEHTLLPRRFPKPSERIAQFLFARETWSQPNHVLQTSSIVCTRAFAQGCQFDPAVLVHQDWDWLIRADLMGAKIIYISEALSNYQLSTTGNTSQRTTWEDSLIWARRIEPNLSKRELGDLYVGALSSRASLAKSFDASWNLILEGAKRGDPSMKSMVTAVLRLATRYLLRYGGRRK